MMHTGVDSILHEVRKVIVGKDDVLEKILMTILSGGHVLLDDVPGTGKTTTALAFSRALGLQYGRIQFTPDVLPSDIVGFSLYRRDTGTFTYQPGAVMTNLLLADEINRTSSKTQSALLEVMEERQVTVDGITHPLPDPFVVIATQNPVGSAGTQLLPQAQLDRFMIRLAMGYPDFASQVNILRDRRTGDPLDAVDTGFEFEAGIRTLAAYHETYFFVSAELRGVRAENFGLEALCIAVHRVHSEQHAREQRGFLAACAAAYLNDNIAVVIRVAREQEHFQILLSALDIFFRFF